MLVLVFYRTFATCDRTDIAIGYKEHEEIYIICSTCRRHQVYKQEFKKIPLPAGRTATDAGRLQLPPLPDGYYFFDYQVKKR